MVLLLPSRLAFPLSLSNVDPSKLTSRHLLLAKFIRNRWLVVRMPVWRALPSIIPPVDSLPSDGTATRPSSQQMGGQGVSPCWWTVDKLASGLCLLLLPWHRFRLTHWLNG